MGYFEPAAACRCLPLPAAPRGYLVFFRDFLAARVVADFDRGDCFGLRFLAVDALALRAPSDAFVPDAFVPAFATFF